MAGIVGRKEEMEVLKKALDSKEAELIAVYGRRRIGKTYLIRNYCEDSLAFELVGMNDGTLKAQLQQFSKSLQQAAKTPLELTPPDNWVTAFTALEQMLSGLEKGRKWVVFFDEFPWLNSRRSGFLEAFHHFWNTWASRQANMVVVICGSAASWMIKNVVNAKGGLHNRISRTIRLLPFTLAETKEYLKSLSINLDHYQVLQLYMAFGGVPHYLRNVERGQSATRAINTICFTETGSLRNEFNNLYRSLFDQAANHIKIVRALAKVPKGLTRQEIIEACGFSSGGGTTDILDELEQSGFIQASTPYKKTLKEAIYRLSDEFSLFYLRFMDRKKISDVDMWARLSSSQTYKIWCGMSFESVCLKHISLIKKALDIGAVQSEEGSWRHSGTKNTSGAQIDLLIDRADRVIDVCEMKFYDGEFTIDKSYAAELDRKLHVFREQIKTKKTVFLIMITTYGVKENEHATRLVDKNLTMDILFGERSA